MPFLSLFSLERKKKINKRISRPNVFHQTTCKKRRNAGNTCSLSKNAPIFFSLSFSSCSSSSSSSSSCEPAREGSIARSSFSNSSSLSPLVSSRFDSPTTVSSRAPEFPSSWTLSALPSESDILPRSRGQLLQVSRRGNTPGKKHPVRFSHIRQDCLEKDLLFFVDLFLFLRKEGSFTVDFGFWIHSPGDSNHRWETIIMGWDYGGLYFVFW